MLHRLTLRFTLGLSLILISVTTVIAQTPDIPSSNIVSVPGFPTTGIPGLAASDVFGSAVAGAGDFNGDGYADLIVGAPGSDAGATDTGRAYLYFGGPMSDGVADLIFTGFGGGDLFGIAVSGAGDINGDGYDDVIVGASGVNVAPAFDVGRAYVYFGGLAADATADLTLTGAAANDNFGVSVAGAGDVNGDGYDDVFVGAFGNDTAGSDAGRAYIFHGGSTPNATPDVTLTGTLAGERFGNTVAGAGDVNGDGYSDVLVGAPYNSTGGANTGRAYVFLGGPSMDVTSEVTIPGQSGENLGWAVSGAGDVNMDGFDDVIIGAPYNDVGGTNRGQSRVYLGGLSMDATADWTLGGAANNDLFGTAVSDAGDLNGDGYGDILVGAYNNDSGGSNAGRAYVFFGGSVLNVSPDIIVTGRAANDLFGYAVANVGDLDGDGLPDIAAGARFADTANGTDSGSVLLISNANTGTGVAEWRVSGAAAGDALGTSVADAGDVNGDGYRDVIVGAPYGDVGGANVGNALLYFGGPTGLATVPGLTYVGEAAGDAFGHAVAGVGDVNGDGYDDVLVGAPFNDAGYSTDYQQGRAYLFYGGAVPDAVPDLVIQGENPDHELGFALAGVGDINGDGYADFVVGVPGVRVSSLVDVGRVYEFHGGPLLDATYDAIFFEYGTEQRANNRFGGAVAGAGDVDGDGLGDVVIGHDATNSSFNDNNVAYVFPTAGGRITLVGENATDRFGAAVASAGDVNGDGYDDILVGAPGFVGGTTGNDGRVYVYFGGVVVDVLQAVSIPGTAEDHQLGIAVSAGDVNGDGFADIIAGSSRGGSEGRIDIFFGGASMDTQTDLWFVGTRSPGDNFGASVSGTGDFNGDGRADVLVGAASSRTAGVSVGAAHLYSATGPAASPAFYRLADISGDQGGYLDLRWTRSGGEMTGDVESYRIERSPPPGTVGYAWETVSVHAASGNPRYSLAAATYSDQTGTNSGITCFRITAQGNAGEKWRSLVKCGASIDNLAPAAPPSLVASASGDGDVLLTVGALASPPPDLAGYRITRSADATCDASDVAVGTALDTGLAIALLEDDATDFGTDLWYCATAIDVHSNESAYVGAVSANPAVLASVKVVLQGAYQSGLPGGALMRTDIEDQLPRTQPYSIEPWGYSGNEAIDPTDVAPANGRPDVLDNNAVVDWVLVAIRSSPGATDGKRAAALLLADGTLLDPATGNSYASVKPAAPGSYHIAVYHRNHVAAMSRYLVFLDGAAPGSEYDLTASAALVYGTNAVANLGGLYGIFAGDGDGNGNVLADDRQAVWLPTVGQTGYFGGDFNLDANVLADDRQSLWAPNVGRQSAVPGASLQPVPESTPTSAKKQGHE